jgi:hypothetical protein
MGDRRDAGLPACRRLICPADCVRSRRLFGRRQPHATCEHPEDSPSCSAAAQYLCRVSPTCWMSTVGIAEASFKIALPSEGMPGGLVMSRGCSHRSSGHSASRVDSGQAAVVRTCGTPWRFATQPRPAHPVALPQRASDDFLSVRATCTASLAPTSHWNLRLRAAHQLSTPSGLDGRHGRN